MPPSCYLELLDKLQKQICRSVGPSLAASLEPLAHSRNVASISLFYGYYFGRCSSELAHWFHFLFLKRRLLIILIDYMIFLSPFLDVTRMSMSIFFLCTAILLNSLPIECFPLTYNLNGFKVGLSPSKKNCFICFNKSPSKVMKKTFYFILKALLVLRILKFLF